MGIKSVILYTKTFVTSAFVASMVMFFIDYVLVQKPKLAQISADIRRADAEVRRADAEIKRVDAETARTNVETRLRAVELAYADQVQSLKIIELAYQNNLKKIENAYAEEKERLGIQQLKIKNEMAKMQVDLKKYEKDIAAISARSKPSREDSASIKEAAEAASASAQLAATLRPKYVFSNPSCCQTVNNREEENIAFTVIGSPRNVGSLELSGEIRPYMRELKSGKMISEFSWIGYKTFTISPADALTHKYIYYLKKEYYETLTEQKIIIELGFDVILSTSSASIKIIEAKLPQLTKDEISQLSRSSFNSLWRVTCWKKDSRAQCE